MREVLSDTAVYLLGRAIPALVGLAVVAFFVRTMGERAYGAYSVAFSGTNLVAVLAVGWLSQSILRFQWLMEARGRASFESTVSAGIKWSSIFGVAALTALLCIMGKQFSTAAVITTSCVLVVGLIIHTAYTASLQAQLRARACAAMEILRAAVTLPAGLLGIMTTHPSYVGAIAGTGIAYVISGTWARSLATRSGPGVKSTREGSSDHSGLQSLLGFGWPISLWLGVSLSFPFAERSLIQHYLGGVATGQYAAVYDVVYRGCGFILLPVVLAIHPRIMRAHVLGELGESRRLWTLGLAFQCVLSLGVTCVIWLMARWIIIVTGVHATDSTLTLVTPLAAAGCVWQMALVSHKLLEARKRTRRMLVFLVGALVLDVTINAALLPKYGVAVAAYALLGTGILYVICAGLDGFRATVNGPT